MNTRLLSAVLLLLILVSAGVMALTRPVAPALVPPVAAPSSPPVAAPPATQDEFEDRPPIIISSGSVILSVARGSWVRETAGRFRQENARGRDVRTFSATTGTGTSACTVTGDAMVVTYGSNAITFGRVMPAGQGARRRHTDMRFPAAAKVNLRDARTLVIETSDPLVSVSNGGKLPQDTCKIVGGRLEVRQVH